ncbi:MAG: hypothetical protein ACLGSH_13665 [Acidobacteriota bacterium]
MRRFFTLVCLIGLALPAGISLAGCTRNTPAKYCPVTSGYGLQVTQVASILLQPQQGGISLAYGQTAQIRSPQAFSCLHDAVSVSTKAFTYGTTNNQLVDLSPTGAICAGTWNRNSGGGTPDYTYCNNPSPMPTTGGVPYSVVYITATADSVTSNPVAVYVHAPVTSVTLAKSTASGQLGAQQCYSQGTVTQLDAEACYGISDNSGNVTQYELCAPPGTTSYSCPGGLAPGVTSVPACQTAIGAMSFTVGSPAIASVNSTNNQITAEQPGTTVITASIAGSGSSAGYFSVCPPASISVTLANGKTSGTITQGVPQNLTTTVYDTKGSIITGLALNYQSTNPINVQATNSGTIATNFPGVAAVNAICQPGICNPAPINELGLNGTGLPISSNPVNITVPGTASNYVWFAAPGQSQYFVPVVQLTGTTGSTVRLPYVPNSMVMDRTGTNLFFGSPRELMVYSTTSNSLGEQSTATPGIVLAVAPDDSRVLINDQARHLFYLFSSSGAAPVSFPGMGNAAEWTPDSQTLYITDNSQLNTPASCGTALITGHTDTLYIYNPNFGWNTYPLPPSPLPPSQIPSCTALPNTAPPTVAQTPGIMIPSVGAYLRGIPTEAHTWCPSGTVGNQASIAYYPLGDTEPSVQSDVLAATDEGHHILTAHWTAGGNISLADLAITIPGTQLKGNAFPTPDACPISTDPVTQAQTLSPLVITPTSVNQVLLSGVTATSVNQVVTGATPVPISGGTGTSLAFITYNGNTAGASLPYYLPNSNGTAGTVGYVPLVGASSITAPIVGAFSPDNTVFLVSTAGDNKIHYIGIPTSLSSTSVPTDTQQISPNLPGCSPATDGGCTFTGTPGTIVPATAIAIKPRPIT